MAELIPLLYKDVLRLDSCRADAHTLDSMNSILNSRIEMYEISEDLQDEIISRLNEIIKEKDLMFKRKDGQMKLIKKKAFWSGFKWGSGVTSIILIVIILL